jgi:hypothetical protein
MTRKRLSDKNFKGQRFTSRDGRLKLLAKLSAPLSKPELVRFEKKLAALKRDIAKSFRLAKPNSKLANMSSEDRLDLLSDRSLAAYYSFVEELTAEKRARAMKRAILWPKSSPTQFAKRVKLAKPLGTTNSLGVPGLSEYTFISNTQIPRPTHGYKLLLNHHVKCPLCRTVDVPEIVAINFTTRTVILHHPTCGHSQLLNATARLSADNLKHYVSADIYIY